MSATKRTAPDLDHALARMGRAVTQRQSAEVIQLPLWPEPKRGTPNSFLRSALFSAIQSKDRQFLKEVTLGSQDGVTVKFTGEQLNQEDLTVWETLIHLARQHPLGTTCQFTAHGLLKALGLPTGGAHHRTSIAPWYVLQPVLSKSKMKAEPIGVLLSSGASKTISPPNTSSKSTAKSSGFTARANGRG